MKRKLAIVLVALVISTGTTSIVFAKTYGGSPDGRDASKSQYGCPAGTSGSHCLPPSGCSHGSGMSGSHNSHSTYDSSKTYSGMQSSYSSNSMYGDSHSSEPSCSQYSSHNGDDGGYYW